LLPAKVKDYNAFRTYTNKIDRKHVDYLLCDPQTVRPLLGVELDDGNHQRSDRQKRDSFVDQVFTAAGLPLVWVLQQNASPAREPGSSQAEAWRTREEPEIAPACPKCGGEMVLKTAKSGRDKGGQFWGCAAYPKCRGIVTAK
jgi:hypothetical protein